MKSLMVLVLTLFAGPALVTACETPEPQMQKPAFLFIVGAPEYQKRFQPQSATAAKPTVTIVALKEQSDGSIYHFHGNVVMTTEALVLRADGLDFDRTKNSVKATGHVSVQMLPK